jgi:hypothetical protein
MASNCDSYPTWDGGHRSRTACIQWIELAGRRIRGEKRWPVIVTLVAAMALPLLLPPRFSLGPKWLVPTVEALLLLALAIADPGLIDRRSTVVWTISLVLVAVLAVGAIGVTVRLFTDLIEGGPETNSASALLGAGFLVWLYIIIA